MESLDCQESHSVPSFNIHLFNETKHRSYFILKFINSFFFLHKLLRIVITCKRQKRLYLYNKVFVYMSFNELFNSYWFTVSYSGIPWWTGILSFHCCGPGSIPDWGTEFLQATWHGKKKILTKNHSFIIYGDASGKEPACQCRKHETWVLSLGLEDPLEEGMAMHSSILAWRIPINREARWAIVYEVAKSWTRLKQLSLHAY